ncbi:MAG: hypothetical protein JWQ27_1986 [Ferruginibacter sp.]|nr:hypothetical protein [Ferruginibacter sp.]
MKRICLLLLAVISSSMLFAQEEEPAEKKFFKKENLFTGGTVNASFFNGTTALGISPYFGYSINRFVDVAVSANLNYISQRDYDQYGDKLRQTIYGPGAFIRLYPVKFLFAHAQYEYNLIRYRYIPPSSQGLPDEKFRFNAPSFLVGGGFANGREGTGSFYYISILWDVLKDNNSPYVDNLNRPLPQIRAGYNIALFQGKDRD